jgi:hypothetical protein
MIRNQKLRVVNTVGCAGLVLLVLAATPVAGLPADSPAGPAKPEALEGRVEGLSLSAL